MSINFALHGFDPALAEAVVGGGAGDGDEDELTVIVRLSDLAKKHEGVKVITQFGDVATLRVQRKNLQELVESDYFSEIEVSRSFHEIGNTQSFTGMAGNNTVDHAGDGDNDEPVGSNASFHQRRPEGLNATGRGCIVAVLDWGVDIACPSFRHADGSTRLRAIWDQRGPSKPGQENRWGYGRILSAEDINQALEQNDPYKALQLDPADSDSKSKTDGKWQGSHGTHVMDIAAGNGRGGGMSGVAPDAELVFVHLSRTAKVLGHKNLGDSASVLEAIDFVFSIAGDRPCVINMSVGAHGGPHDGMTLVEQGIDQAVWLRDGCAVVNSGGNYFSAKAHSQGRLQTGEVKKLQFRVEKNDPTTSELEVYYENGDRFVASVIGPGQAASVRIKLGDDAPLIIAGLKVGHIYHRRRASGERHIDIFLRPNTPAGVWQLVLESEHSKDGRFHAWIERDSGKRPYFISEDIATTSTTGTLCNGKFSITVGAYDARQATRPMGRFSSSGPTRDGRIKPEVVAPGVAVYAAQSTPPGHRPGPRYTSKSGTSMAAPHVAGAIALMFEAAAMPLGITDTRALLFSSLDNGGSSQNHRLSADVHRMGYGYLDILAAEKIFSAWGKAARKRANDLIDSNNSAEVLERVNRGYGESVSTKPNEIRNRIETVALLMSDVEIVYENCQHSTMDTLVQHQQSESPGSVFSLSNRPAVICQTTADHSFAQ